MLITAVPQAQGASTARAGELPSGCRALAALAGSVLDEPVREVPVSTAGSPRVGGVANRAALIGNRGAQLAALEAPGGPVLTVGGDCGVELVPVGLARYRYSGRFGVVWFDAHPDLNTARTSPSGAFHGMVLRSLLGEGDPEFAADPAVDAGSAVLVGTRAFDDGERAALGDGLARHVPVPGRPADVLHALRGAGVERVYVHIDVDVLDPGEFAGLNCPEAGGLTVDGLVGSLHALAAFDVVGAGITECVASDPDTVDGLAPVVTAVGELLTGR